VSGVAISGNQPGITNYYTPMPDEAMPVRLEAPSIWIADRMVYTFKCWTLEGEPQPTGEQALSFELTRQGYEDDPTAEACYEMAGPFLRLGDRYAGALSGEEDEDCAFVYLIAGTRMTVTARNRERHGQAPEIECIGADQNPIAALSARTRGPCRRQVFAAPVSALYRLVIRAGAPQTGLVMFRPGHQILIPN
jgi:hypothetical protein